MQPHRGSDSLPWFRPKSGLTDGASENQDVCKRSIMTKPAIRPEGVATTVCFRHDGRIDSRHRVLVLRSLLPGGHVLGAAAKFGDPGHGAAFTLWIFSFVVTDVARFRGRVDLHRRLGIFGFSLACAMVVLGSMAATDLLRRAHAPSIRPCQTFYASSLGTCLFLER